MDWVQKLSLVPHPEGGWFRRIYTNEASVQTPHGVRQAATSIHYLLTAAHPQGRFHRVRSTILHFLQSGGPVQYACIDGAGVVSETVLGHGTGQQLFLPVAAGVWKCSRLIENAEHALISEVVLPGFDWADHEYLDVDQLPPHAVQQLRASGWLHALKSDPMED